MRTGAGRGARSILASIVVAAGTVVGGSHVVGNSSLSGSVNASTSGNFVAAAGIASRPNRRTSYDHRVVHGLEHGALFERGDRVAMGDSADVASGDAPHRASHCTPLAASTHEGPPDLLSRPGDSTPPRLGSNLAFANGCAPGNGDAGSPTAPPGQGYVVTFQQHTPSAMVLVLVLLMGVSTSVVIMALGKRSGTG